MKKPGLLRLFVVLGAIAFARAAEADVVTAWNAAALNAIRIERTAPPRASRALAILHTSIFDAVNGIARTHEAFLVESGVPASASKEAAASAAAHTVLMALFPAQAENFENLHAATLAGIANGPQKARGIAWGESVAVQILASRANDNSEATVTVPPVAGPGAWVPTPPGFAAYALPHWGSVQPFAMPTNAHFRPLGPPALTSPQYADEYNEVKSLGAAVGSNRTTEQSLIALFWADGAGTETPPGHWNTIATGISEAAGNTIEQNARLFALLNMAMADAAVCAWDAKYTYMFWRPVTAIQNGDTDGNESTIGDPSWSSFIATPPFPDYVSGHSTFSGAASKVLALFYGTDDIEFNTGSDFLPGVTRHFNSFSEAANEAALSRLYGGIHYRAANADGLESGVGIGEWTFTHMLLPKQGRARK